MTIKEKTPVGTDDADRRDEAQRVSREGPRRLGCGLERPAGDDRRQARPVRRDGQAGPVTLGGAGAARPGPTSDMSASGCSTRRPAATSSTTRRAAVTRCHPSTRRCSPSLFGGFQTYLAAARAEVAHRGGIPDWRGMPGASTTPSVFVGSSASSVPATSSSSSRPGSRPLMASPTKLEQGATVADVGCGHGASTIILAQAYPTLAVRRLRQPRSLDRSRAAGSDRGWRQ